MRESAFYALLARIDPSQDVHMRRVDYGQLFS